MYFSMLIEPTLITSLARLWVIIVFIILQLVGCWLTTVHYYPISTLYLYLGAFGLNTSFWAGWTLRRVQTPGFSGQVAGPGPQSGHVKYPGLVSSSQGVTAGPRVASTVTFPIGDHVNVLYDYKKTNSETSFLLLSSSHWHAGRVLSKSNISNS